MQAMRIPKQALLTIGIAASTSLLITGFALHQNSPKTTHLALNNSSITQPAKPPLIVTSKSTTPATLGSSTTATPTTRTSANSPTSQTPTAPANTQTPPSSQPANGSTSPSNQATEPAITIHVDGYPPALSATLTPDFENPIHVPCGGQLYPKNVGCNYNQWQWVASKYCIYTYADNHTQRQLYQYQAYGDIYSNPDGSLNPSGINMAITSDPTYGCNVASAPKSVFEPNYTYLRTPAGVS